MSAPVPAPARTSAALIAAAQAQGLLPPQAGSDWQRAHPPAPAWPLAAMSFIGAQLVALPLLMLLALLANEAGFELLNTPNALIASAPLLAAALLLLRWRPGMFLQQMAFSLLVCGLILLALGMLDWPTLTQLLMLLLTLTALVLLTPTPWVQAILAALATGVALCIWPQLHAMPGKYDGFLAFPHAPSAAALALLWALAVASEQRWRPGRWLARVQPALGGMGVALLLAAACASGLRLRPWGRAAGSADVADAGLAALLRLDAPAALQMALVTAAACWLAWHWQLHRAGDAAGDPRGQARLALAWAVWLLACLAMPLAGVVALVAAVALGTGRRALAGLALAVLLLGLSGFYYALAWPLTDKAALLAATGAALALGLGALRAGSRSGHIGSPPGDAPATGQARQTGLAMRARMARLAPAALTALGALLALGMVRHDVRGKEQVIAQGRKLYVALAPADPRSLMQGDYMALNFALPPKLPSPTPFARTLHAVARVDARGVATVQRLAQPGQALAADELLLPLRHMQRGWTLVTDAFHFPEGQGRPLLAAKFGEFRTLPDGRALLVGLADAQLQPVAPAPAPASDADDESSADTAAEARTDDTGAADAPDKTGAASAAGDAGRSQGGPSPATHAPQAPGAAHPAGTKNVAPAPTR